MASKIVAFRLPESLIQLIETRAAAVNTSKTAIVVDALQKALGSPTAEMEMTTVDQLRFKLTHLETKVDRLAQQMTEHQAVRSLTADVSLPQPGLTPTFHVGEWLTLVQRLTQEALVAQSQQPHVAIRLQHLVSLMECQVSTLDQMLIAYKAMEQRNHELERHNAELRQIVEQCRS